MQKTLDIPDDVIAAGERAAAAAGQSLDSLVADLLRWFSRTPEEEEQALGEMGAALAAEAWQDEDFSDWERADDETQAG